MRGPGEGPALLSKLLPSSTMKAAGQKRTKATPVTGHGRAKQNFAHNPSLFLEGQRACTKCQGQFGNLSVSR
jgi:hypothetical protein